PVGRCSSRRPGSRRRGGGAPARARGPPPAPPRLPPGSRSWATCFGDPALHPIGHLPRPAGKKPEPGCMLVSDSVHLSPLDVAGIWTFTLDAARRFAWSGGVGLPASLDELAARTPTADRARVVAAFEDALAGRAVLALELRLAFADRGERWLLARGRRDERGVAGAVLDVTDERREAARAAEEQAALLRLSTSETLARGDFDAALDEISVVGGALLDARAEIWLLNPGGDALSPLGGGPERHASAHPALFAALRGREVLNVQAARHLAAEGVAALLQAPVFDGGPLARAPAPRAA